MKHPSTKAAGYALDRETALRVFLEFVLEFPNVPIDTNHLEREIRPIAMGRKTWLFCWTEIGAECVGVVQSLLATCRLQDVDPYNYLVDVLQRIDKHPVAEVAKLTPRLWKSTSPANRSDQMSIAASRTPLRDRFPRLACASRAPARPAAYCRR